MKVMVNIWLFCLIMFYKNRSRNSVWQCFWFETLNCLVKLKSISDLFSFRHVLHVKHLNDRSIHSYCWCIIFCFHTLSSVISKSIIWKVSIEILCMYQEIKYLKKKLMTFIFYLYNPGKDTKRCTYRSIH